MIDKELTWVDSYRRSVIVNLNIRKFVAATAIVGIGAISLPVNAAIQNTAVVEPAGQQVAQSSNLIPLRGALTAVGVDVDWVDNNGVGTVVLNYGGRTLQAVVDSANGVLKVLGNSYAYDNIKGSLYVEFDFYAAIFENAAVSINQYNGINLTALDANQLITLKQEAVPVAPQENYTYYESGQATWYGSGAQGNYTASGEVFNMYDYTAAHKYLPFGTKVRVTDVNSGKSVIVRINDRGPFGAGRVIDLSYQAASALGIVSQGVANVKLEILS